MHSFGSPKQFILRARSVDLSRCAAAGAIVICAAIVLNVGPFAGREADGRSGSALQKERFVITELPAEQVTASLPDMEISAQPESPQSLTHTTPPSQPFKHWFDLASLSILDFAAPQALAAKDGAAETQIDETQVKSPTQQIATPDPNAHKDASTDPFKKAAMVGVWAPDAGTCSARNFRQGVLPAVINSDGAWAGETFCIFKNKKQTEAGWKVVAECSNSRERWTANVRLIVDGNRLTWTSKRGTQTYTRCASDVLMAQAP